VVANVDWSHLPHDKDWSHLPHDKDLSLTLVNACRQRHGPSVFVKGGKLRQ